MNTCERVRTHTIEVQVMTWRVILNSDSYLRDLSAWNSILIQFDFFMWFRHHLSLGWNTARTINLFGKQILGKAHSYMTVIEQSHLGQCPVSYFFPTLFQFLSYVFCLLKTLNDANVALFSLYCILASLIVCYAAYVYLNRTERNIVSGLYDRQQKCSFMIIY